MYEIDKRRFAEQIGRLRREKGMTQKELAEKLYVSDKAVSKWETAVSLPDTALLVPLAEVLGVTVSELLTGQKDAESADPEEAVKTALAYSEHSKRPAQLPKARRRALYFVLLVLMLAEMAELYYLGFRTADLIALQVLAAVFGGYFFLWAREQLPVYYDQNAISSYSDGIFRMNLPGVRFTNGNWPYLVRVGRIWSACMMTLHPLLYWAAFQIPFLRDEAPFLPLAVYLGGLLVPVYIVAKKYQ